MRQIQNRYIWCWCQVHIRSWMQIKPSVQERIDPRRQGHRSPQRAPPPLVRTTTDDAYFDLACVRAWICSIVSSADSMVIQVGHQQISGLMLHTVLIFFKKKEKKRKKISISTSRLHASPAMNNQPKICMLPRFQWIFLLYNAKILIDHMPQQSGRIPGFMASLICLHFYHICLRAEVTIHAIKCECVSNGNQHLVSCMLCSVQ